MTSLSRIARLARIPEIRKKKRENDPRKKKRDDSSDKDRPAFPLKGTFSIKKPATSTPSRVPTSPKPPQKPLDDGIGERLDLKV